jgi:3-phenylpropionate/cinnamic acid dioxygenase small subunit
MSGFASDHELVEFVYHEARLIDEKRLVEWLDLFTEDGLYYMPLTRDQPDGRLHTSLYYEDRLLLQLRIERLNHPNAFSQSEPSWCQHVLQVPRIESRAPDEVVLRTPYTYAESQGDRQDVYLAVAWHHLKMQDGRLKMRMKKIDLLNRTAALPSIQLFL